jgi:hypothetical protein
MTYSFRPRPIGGALTLNLTHDALEVSGGMKVIRILFRDITRVQLVYRPSSLLQARYILYVRDTKGARLKVSNATYRGLAEMVIQDETFQPFLKEFLSKVPPSAQRVKGETQWRYGVASLACLGVSAFSLAALYKLILAKNLLWFAIFGAIVAYVFALIYLWLKENKPSKL